MKDNNIFSAASGSNECKPIPLSPEYMAAVRAMENASWNQNGADKSWMPRAYESLYGTPKQEPRL
jgi:hypothetical protein